MMGERAGMQHQPVPYEKFFRRLFPRDDPRLVVRRQIREIDAEIGRAVFFREARSRGYQVFENADQYIVFCNNMPIRRIG